MTAQELSKKRFVSFDGGVTVDSTVAQPKSLSLENFTDLNSTLRGGRRIPRGSGLSFAAASFGENVTSVDLASFNQIIAFDDSSGIVEVQCGATMGDIYNYLLDRGRYLPVQPGYPTITTGGCIAVDVHGKNQYADGNFSRYLSSFKLMRPTRGIVEVNAQNDPELFQLTAGGYGLTGYILSAKLQTRALPGTEMETVVEPLDKIEDTPALLQEAAETYDSTISWHDLSAGGSAFGRGFLLNARFIKGSAAPAHLTTGQSDFVSSDDRDSYGRSFFSLPLNRVINSLYGGIKRHSTASSPALLHQCLYPSRLMRNAYFKLFGPAGFHECQLIIAPERFEEYVQSVRTWLKKHNLPITLASAKYFEGERKDLRFQGRGICFALNFPRLPEGDKFMQYIDQLTVSLNGLPYIAKDSRLPLAVVRDCYSDYDNFKKRLIKHDGERLFGSELSARLEL